MKTWTSTEKGDDKIIVYANETIYKANPPESETDACLFDLKTQQKISKHFFGIPLQYVSTITLEEGKEYIEILFRGDTEHLRIKDDASRNEVFAYFKTNLPGATYAVIQPSKFQKVKKPLVAMGVICGIFLWSLYLAVGMEAGVEYKVTGDRYNSLAGIALALGSLGVHKVIMIFGSLFLIAAITLIRKYKAHVVKHTLSIKG